VAQLAVHEEALGDAGAARVQPVEQLGHGSALDLNL
jgi:hypothetical protein